MTRTSSHWPVLGLLPLLCGCVFGAGGKETVFEESERIYVRFASVDASHQFHEGLERSSVKRFTDGRGFVFALVIGGGSSTYYETQHYNHEVRLADVDRDGLITEEEASAYRRLVFSKPED